MSKFKVGDIVVLKEDYQGVPAGTTLTITRGAAALYESSGLWWTKEMPRGVYGYRLELYSRPADDELPPAPKSVLYINEFLWGVQVNSLGDVLQVGVGDPNSNKHGWVYASLDADTALQLCHDLRRMAMEIKRKEKQDD